MKKVKSGIFKNEMVKVLLLTIALILGFSSVGSAASTASSSVGETKTVEVEGQNPVEVTVLVDNKKVKVVKTRDTVTNETYTTSFNKDTKVMESVDGNGTEVFNSIKKAQQLKAQQVITPLAGSLLDSNQDRTGKYKYYYYTGKIWVLMAPDRYAKNPIENPDTNSSNILSFRSSVNTLRDKQNLYNAALAGMSGSVALAVATATSTLGWSFVLGALASIGFGATALAQAAAVNQAAKDATFFFDRVTIK